VRFTPSTDPDSAGLYRRLLADLPEVTDVRRHGGQVLVTGGGNLLHAVTAVLARHQIIAHDLRIDQASLDDAFVALTGRPLDQ
jgi:ABC-2 type transport system ATP-binding protein